MNAALQRNSDAPSPTTAMGVVVNQDSNKHTISTPETVGTTIKESFPPDLEPKPQTDEELLPPRLSSIRICILASVMLLTYFLGAASTQSVTLLIPSIARELRETELQTQWIASSYTLAYACGLLFSGRLADILGRKKLYLVGLAIYGIFAIITGVLRVGFISCRADKVNTIGLSVTRALSGLGLSISAPAGFRILGANIRHEPARTIAFAAAGLGMPVGAAFGMLLGGLMARIRIGSWSYLFFLLGGTALFLLVVAFFAVPPDIQIGNKAEKRIDWVGGLLVTAGICLFTFSLTESGIAPKGWRSIYVPALLITSIFLICLFVIWSLHLEHRTSFPPIIKISLFTRQHGLISIICACGFFSATCIFGWAYTAAIFYQKYKGMTPFQNSIATLATPVVGTIAAGAVMYLAPRVKTPYLLGGGSILTAACSIMYALRPEGTSYWALEFPAQILHPWGIDFIFGLGNILISNLVDQSEQSVGGALFQMSGQLGAALGTCFSSLISTEVANKAAGDVLLGVRAAFWFSAAAGLIAMVLAVIGLRKVGLAKDVSRFRK